MKEQTTEYNPIHLKPYTQLPLKKKAVTNRLWLLHVLWCLCLSGCTSEHTVKVYSYETIADDFIIRGNNREQLFNAESPNIKVKVDKKRVNNEPYDVLQELKKKALKRGVLYTNELDVEAIQLKIISYKYAIVFDSDTLFINNELSALMHRKHTLLLNDDASISTLKSLVADQ